VRINIIATLIIILCSVLLSAQDSLTDSIEVITIQSLRLNTDTNRSPLLVHRENFQANNFLLQQLSLQEYLSDAPGLFSLNASNYAQDLRISIRGFGARSAFGIRGIKLVVDGIPETTPDGQGQLDNLMLSTVSSIEIINGPSSALYGNASGGVIYINTLEDIDKSFAEVGSTFGSYGLQQYSLNGGLVNDNTTVIANYLYTGLDGYRVQSSLRQHAANVKLIHEYKSATKLRIGLNYTNSPTADDPGGINLESVETDRRQARDRNVLFETGEKINHSKLYADIEHPLNKNTSLEAYGFYSIRNFVGKLPFGFGGWVDLSRQYWGVGTSLTQKKINATNVITNKIGFDIANQADDRMRFFNNEGIQGDMTLNQQESFRSMAFFYLGQANFDVWDLFVGLRYDLNRLSSDDKFLQNGDDSGQINMPAFTQSVGINYQMLDHLSMYLNFRQSFETPTLSELSANPNGQDGFNEMLDPQKANNFEIGFRVNSPKFSGSLAGFYIRTTNDIVPFEIQDFPDRDFFRNAGSSDRTGIEASINTKLSDRFSLSGMYSYSNFKYDEYFVSGNQFDGNRLPAIPIHQGSWRLSYESESINISLQQRLIGSLYTNDANAFQDDAYSLVHLKAGFTLALNNVTLKPFAGIHNIFNTLYNDNIRINAFGSRFFEPGPERNVYLGVRVRFE